MISATRPPPKGKSAVAGALTKTDLTECLARYHSRTALQVSCEIQWRKEANRLVSEWRRTGSPAHLRAFQIHRAAAWKAGVHI